MKNIIIGIFCINLFAITATAQNTTDTASAQNKESDFQIVETSCGQCNFNLPGKGCDLAIRIRGIAYFVDGTNIDDHGDAHASDGFCTAIRKARVKGAIVDNRFKSQYFKLIPLAGEEKETK
jgi:hypothetical protein